MTYMIFIICFSGESLHIYIFNTRRKLSCCYVVYTKYVEYSSFCSFTSLVQPGDIYSYLPLECVDNYVNLPYIFDRAHLRTDIESLF